MNERAIRFAVSVPVKTGFAYLPFALRSLARQCLPLEVALLDASGNDGVRALSDRHDRMIRYRRHVSEDAGQSAAIQEGWDHLGGDLLGWLNADDMLLPGALETVADVFSANPEMDVVYGHAVYLGEGWEFQTYFPSLSSDPSALRQGNIICQPAAFVRRRAVERVGGLDPSLRFTMDWDLWLRLYEAGCRFHLLAAPLAMVINHGGTKTNTGGVARYREIDRILRRNGDLRARVAGQVGHRRTEAAFTGAPAGRMIEWAMRTAGLVRARRRSANIFGIEPGSNLVKGHCRIVMGWYQDSAPHMLHVAVEPVGPIRVRCNGVPLELEGVPAAGVWTAMLSPSESGLYELDMERDKPWRLEGLRLVA